MNPSHLRILFLNLSLAVLYVLFSKIGFRLAFLNSQVSPIWPPEGLGFASLLLGGTKFIPGIYLGAFFANYLNNPHLPTAIVIGLGNTLSSFLAFRILKAWSGGLDPLYSLKTLFGFLTISTVPGALVSASMGVTSLLVFGFLPKEVYWNVFFTWFSGEMQGFLIVGPLLFVWLQKFRSFPWTFPKRLELVFLVLLVYISGRIAFSDVLPLLFLPIPFLVLTTLRFREWGATLASAVISFAAVLQTVEGTGVFAMRRPGGELSINDSLIYLDAFLFSMNGICYLLVAVTRERERAQREAMNNLETINRMKEATNEELERKVEERTKIIQDQTIEIQKQLDVAKRIQESLFPHNPPTLPNYEFAFQNVPMMQVGGDFFDIQLSENKTELGLFICDVSGHGIPAAFLSALVKMSLANWGRDLSKIPELFKEIRKQLQENLSGHFITASAVQIDLPTGKITFARAGHFPLYIIQKTGNLVTLAPTGRIIANFFEPVAQPVTYQLSQGDMIVLLTDGLTEARPLGADRKFYTEERLLDFIMQRKDLPLSQIKDDVFQEILQYSGGLEMITDDLTLVLCKYKN